MLTASIIRSLLTDRYYISPVPAGLMPGSYAGYHFATLIARAATMQVLPERSSPQDRTDRARQFNTRQRGRLAAYAGHAAVHAAMQ